MSWSLLLFLIVGLPLILLSGGFFVLMLIILKGRDKSANRNQTLEIARSLERTLSQMENRLGALEDILLNPDHEKDACHD